MASLGTAHGGAFSLHVVGETVVNGELVVEMEARPRWWSWRYWLFLWHVSRPSNWEEV